MATKRVAWRLAVTAAVAVAATAWAIPSHAGPSTADRPVSPGSPSQVAGIGSYQIHQNVSGSVVNRGGFGAADWVVEQIDEVQDPGPDTDPPGAIFLNESCRDIVEQLEVALEGRFGVTYTMAFHNHFLDLEDDDLPPGTAAGVCDGDHDGGEPGESEFGVAVLQLGAGGTPITQRFSAGVQYPRDEVRGYACVEGESAQQVSCSAHMNFKRISPSEEDVDDPDYDEDDDTIYAREQFREYWGEIQDLVTDHELPVVWSGDVYRTPDEIAAENPGFYAQNIEADSDSCSSPSPLPRPTVTNGNDRKMDHVFLTNAEVPSCDQVHVTPITELCDHTPGVNARPVQATTSTTTPNGDNDCDYGVPDEDTDTGTEGSGKFDHSLIRSHFDVGVEDVQAPATSASVDPPANGAGWHSGPVTVNLESTDDLSGVESITYEATGAQTEGPTTIPGDSASLTVDVEGTTTVEYFATDRAGNVEATKSLVVHIDETAPSVVGDADRPPDSNDWYSAPFTVDWTGADALSGIASCESPATYSGPDTNLGVLIGHCIDVAGNVGTGNFTFHYDATAPSVTASPDRGPDFGDWYNEPVTVSFSGNDATSGIASCDPPVTYSGPDGEDLTVAGDCVDVAGNSATSSFGPFQYDDTDPTATITGGALQLILNVLDPTMSGTADDNLAGIWLIAVEFANALDPSDTTTRLVVCPSGCLGQVETAWTVDTTGLAGTYNVRAIAADLAGNAGTWSSPVTAIIL